MSESGASAIAEETAFTVVKGDPDAPVFITCEHASQRLPAPWSWPEADQRLVGTHWAYDLGAREITLELAAALRATAVLAEFSRLLVDANRAEGHPDLFRPVADGELVMLNQSLSPSERELRMHRYHRPYHQAVDTALLDARAPLLFSVHSFTPVYEGTIRNVELGVLYDEQEEHAFALGAALARELPNVAYNEPWSGKDGLIYSAEVHSRRNQRVALEIEVRQDLAVDPSYRARLIPLLADYISQTFVVR
ncbi:MAG: N-formylglutamate amidohydrolase [Myxococcales bacterium]